MSSPVHMLLKGAVEICVKTKDRCRDRSRRGSKMERSQERKMSSLLNVTLVDRVSAKGQTLPPPPPPPWNAVYSLQAIQLVNDGFPSAGYAIHVIIMKTSCFA